VRLRFAPQTARRLRPAAQQLLPQRLTLSLCGITLAFGELNNSEGRGRCYLNRGSDCFSGYGSVIYHKNRFPHCHLFHKCRGSAASLHTLGQQEITDLPVEENNSVKVESVNPPNFSALVALRHLVAKRGETCPLILSTDISFSYLLGSLTCCQV
jgi:hypothetical protein